MVWLLLSVTGVLALLVVALAALVLGLRSRVGALEQSAPRSPSSDANVLFNEPVGSTFASLDEKPAAPDFVITRIGEPVAEVPVVPATVFADIVAREAVVQAASLAAGLRRALDPETRNRIRFHMRQEVRRSRKQRKLELREVRREWAARQREAGATGAGEAGAA